MSGSVSRRSSSQYAERCKYCKNHQLSTRFVHVTESEMAHMILAGDCGRYEDPNPDYTMYGWHELPLDGHARWIHVIKETKNEDLGSTKRHSDPVRGQAGA